MKKILFFTLISSIVTLSSCSNDEPYPGKGPIIDPVGESALFVVNSGNFGSGNASLSVLNPDGNSYVNNFFFDANHMLLGDVAQSMSIGDGKGWIVVNNSNVIFAIDPATGRELGRIDAGITSPRNFYYIDSQTAYVTQMYDSRIAIVNPSTYKVTDYIDVAPSLDTSSGGSTEEMIFDGNYAYVNCWSYQKNILKIDLSEKKVVASLEVGIQPCSIALDVNGVLWALTDGGGWEENPIGYEAPELVKINPVDMTVLERFSMSLGDSVSSLLTADDGHTLYWLNGGVWKMDINASSIPTDPFISTSYWPNALTVSPDGGTVYVADAVDYMQAGTVYAYTDGTLRHSYQVGIIPNAFCWLTK